MKLKRKRDAGETTSQILRTPGRPGCQDILPESLDRRRRRDGQKAVLNASILMQQIL
jgi:hypothetical protein